MPRDPIHTFERVDDDPTAGIPLPTDDDFRGPTVARINGHSPVVEEELDPSWVPIPLGPVLAGNYRQPEPEILRRDDYQSLFYRGSVNGIHGDSGTGKGWVVGTAIGEQLNAGRSVLYLDLEDNEVSISSRLSMLGCAPNDLIERLIYVRPMVPFATRALEHLETLIVAANVSLVIIDSVGEAFALEGIDENKDSEVGPWMRRVARPLAETGACVLLVDHSTKAGDNTLHPSGSKRKRAAITGASYLIEAPVPLVKGKGGRLRITCAKDRHGTYARGEIAADLVLSPTVGDGLRAVLYAPNDSEPTAKVPILLSARAAVAAAKAEGTAMSMRSLIASMAIKASRDVKIGGIELAASRGALTETPGVNRSRMFTYTAELPEVAA